MDSINRYLNFLYFLLLTYFKEKKIISSLKRNPKTDQSHPIQSLYSYNILHSNRHFRFETTMPKTQRRRLTYNIPLFAFIKLAIILEQIYFYKKIILKQQQTGFNKLHKLIF